MKTPAWCGEKILLVRPSRLCVAPRAEAPAGHGHKWGLAPCRPWHYGTDRQRCGDWCERKSIASAGPQRARTRPRAAAFLVDAIRCVARRALMHGHRSYRAPTGLRAGFRHGHAASIACSLWPRGRRDSEEIAPSALSRSMPRSQRRRRKSM